MVLNLRHDILRLLKEQAPPTVPTSEPPADPASAPAAPADPTNIPVDPNAPPPDPNAPVDPNTTVDPNAPIDPNAPVDPNAPIDPNESVGTNAPSMSTSGGAADGGTGSGGSTLGGSSVGGGGGGMGSSSDSSGKDEGTSEGEEDGGSEVEVPDGSPKISKDDPVGAIYDTALEIAKTTIDPQLILNSVKSSMQANFGSNMEDAWPLVQRLKDTENSVLGDVAQRLSLFINGTIQENIKKGKRTMTANKERPANNIILTEKQLVRIIKNTVKRINEGNMFDTHRSQIDQERSAIESQLSGTEVKEMAIDLFEKMCQKAGLDADGLTPEAQEYVEKELQTLVHSAQDIASKLSHVARVLGAAAEGTEKKSEGKG